MLLQLYSIARPLLSDHISTIGMQDLPRDVSRIWARKEDEAGGHFDWLAWASHGDILPEPFLGFLRHGGRDERRPYGTGSDDVDANTLLSDQGVA